MTTYVDTSAFVAVLNRSDENHDAARRIWKELLSEQDQLLTTSYVLVETIAVVQRRLGMEAARAFQESIVPLLRIEWVDAMLHRAGVSAVLTANRRDLSLVDCVSFAVMRQLGLSQAFAFDAHFGEQGFQVLSG
jgi:predicted nucleic acid-binding protein